MDKHIEAVREKLLSRSEVGLNKYGVTTMAYGAAGMVTEGYCRLHTGCRSLNHPR